MNSDEIKSLNYRKHWRKKSWHSGDNSFGKGGGFFALAIWKRVVNYICNSIFQRSLLSDIKT